MFASGIMSLKQPLYYKTEGECWPTFLKGHFHCINTVCELLNTSPQSSHSSANCSLTTASSVFSAVLAGVQGSARFLTWPESQQRLAVDYTKSARPEDHRLLHCWSRAVKARELLSTDGIKGMWKQHWRLWEYALLKR